MNIRSNGTLKAPGASIYHEIRGAGPVLVFIPGGNGDAGPYERVAEALATSFTTVIYDRRGYSRSPLDAPLDGTEDTRSRLAVEGDDAIGLLDQVSDGPAYFFGSSSGAILGLDLVTRHPNRVATLVAHEPPLVELLPDAQAHRAFFDEVYDIFRRDGVDEAMARFNAGIGMAGMPDLPPGVQLPPQVLQMLARMRVNQEFWLEHELRQYTSVVPDLDALAAGPARVVLAVGEESRQLLPYRPSVILAERLGDGLAEFPGGHVGYVTHPTQFATRLAAVFSG